MNLLDERAWSIIDNLKEVVFQTDAEGRWTFLNRAWTEITGFPVEESLGVVFLEYVYPEDHERNAAELRKLISREKDSCRHEIRYRTKDGGVRWIEVHARLTLDEAGAIIGTSGTLSDVTARRLSSDELREARRRLEFVLASNPAVIYAGRMSEDGGPWGTTFVSESVRTVFGYSPECFTDNPGFWLGTVHPEDIDELPPLFAQLTACGEASARLRLRRGDGSYRWMRNHVRLSGAPDGTIETFGCIIDETHTREIEESLRSHAAVLEAVGFAAQRFLESASWRGVIGDVLARLGSAAGASRVCLFEKSAEGEAVSGAELRHEWTRSGFAAESRGGELLAPRLSDSGRERWSDAVRRGEPVQARASEFAGASRDELARRGVRSLLMEPVLTGRRCWGFIVFEDCVDERQWPAAEVDALRAAAATLGAAIQREQTESALRYSEALLRTVTDSSPFGVLVVDEETGGILYSNDRFGEIWGIADMNDSIRRGEVSSDAVLVRCLPMLMDSLDFAAPVSGAATDYLAFCDGRTIRRFTCPIRDAADATFGRLYVFEDVTAQKRAESALEARVQQRTADLVRLNERLRSEIAERRAMEQALANREARFRTMIENSSDVILVTDRAGVVEYASPALARIFGYTPEELAGRCWTKILANPAAGRAFRDALPPAGSQPPVELQAAHRDGSTRWIEALRNNQLANPAVGGIVITIRDLTERRRLEDQFRQAQKMEAIGRLAGGVAHDFNNLLTVICGYSELLDRRLGPEEGLRRPVGEIRRAGQRATALVSQLLAFSRKQVTQPSVFDLNEAVADLEKMLRRLIGEDIELTIALTGAPLYVKIDRTQLDQVLMNLSVNARDAMPQGGALSITLAAHTPLGVRDCRGCRIASGRFAVLAVRDSGCGMSAEVQAHMFEPFFTTKDVGKGTGLGLSMVYGAVEQAGGHICVESVPGEGSEFRICVPLAASPDAVEEAPLDVPMYGGSGTILLAEDEDLVRAMMADTLRESGYRVIEARDGVEAMEAAVRAGGAVDLLLTDVVMPRMNGPELVSRIAAEWPAVKVLFVSGYPRQELPAGCAFLRKPFRTEELLAEIREVLDSTGRSLSRLAEVVGQPASALESESNIRI